MSLTLEAAYTRTGLEPVNAQNDAILEMAMNTALAVVENYLDRKITFDSSEDKFYYNHHTSFALDRYPIEQINDIGADGRNFSGRYKVHRETGIIVMPQYSFSEEVVIRYTGGYRVLPADLESAFWLIFDGQYSIQMGGGATTSGTIDSITVSDVGTIRFDNGTSGSSSGGGNDSVGFLTDDVISLLRPYRRYSA